MNDLDESIGKWISMLYRFTKTYLERELSEYGIGSSQFVCLINLLAKDGIHQEELSSIEKIDKGTITRSLQKLEKLGYVSRIRDTNDRRAYRIYLTDKGLNMKDKIFEVSDKWTTVLSKNLTSEEKEIAIILLRQMAENAVNYSTQEDSTT